VGATVADINHTVTWSVSIELTSGEPPHNKDVIYFNIPTGMSVISLISTDGFSGYNLDAAALEEKETGFPDPNTKEYAIAFPAPGDHLTPFLAGTPITFDIVFHVDADAVCTNYPLYIEIIHEDSLMCNLSRHSH